MPPADHVADHASAAADAPELPGGILRFTLPMPPPLGHVHVWLIPTGNGWAMFDAGFPSPQGVDKLEQEIQPLLTDGRRLEAVFISHYHPDHTAFAGRLQRAFDCDVYVHEADWDRMQMMNAMRQADDGSGEAFRRRFSSGWTESLDDHQFDGEQSQDASDSMFSRMRDAMKDIDLPMPEPTVLQGGEVIEVGGRNLEAIWTPGHTDGHLCVRELDQDALFTGDHLLGRITPHIGMWPDQERSPLPDFEESLKLVQELNSSIALPAHEAIIEHPAERAAEILEHHQERRVEMLNAVSDGNHSVKDIAIQTFPKRAHDRMQLTMAMSETVAHLEALVEEEQLTRSGGDVDRRYTLA